MSFDEFWNCSPSRYKFYREAHRLRNEQKNQEMWLQGFYVFKAFETALHNQPAFTTKPVKPINYLQSPIELEPPSEDEKHKREEAEKEKKLEGFTKYLTDFQKNWEQKHGRYNHKENKD